LAVIKADISLMTAFGGRLPPIDATLYLIEKDGVTADEAKKCDYG
jgi:hypothetical protein